MGCSTRVWVGNASPQAPGHLTSICDIGVNLIIIGGKKEDKKIKIKKKTR